MNKEKLRKYWKTEEAIAHIHGWDFSHIEGRYVSKEDELPWNYNDILKKFITPDKVILDMDTGGGEFLLSLHHPYDKTSATEGYPPNVELCKKTLLPLGIDFREMNNYEKMPFEREKFDVIINRHGAYSADEIYRTLKPDGVFITQQVGEENDRELVELLLPHTKKSFYGMNMINQKKVFEQAGFTVLQTGEAFCPIRFYDIGALVWFARIIQWEFVDFSVDQCFDRLLEAQEILECNGYVEGMIHRYLIVAGK